MKKILGYIMMFLVLIVVSTSCDDVLDQKAVDSFNEASVFEDINLTKAYLGNCYDKMGGDGGQVLGMREDLLACATDEVLDIHRPSGIKFVKGTMSPDELGHFGNWRFSWINWERMYSNIKNVNVFMANIDNVPIETSNDEAKISIMKGEGFFLRALAYSNIMRSYGGVVLVDQPFELDDDFLNTQRSTLEETVNFILSDLDQAISLLPKADAMEQGRATKGAAASLKSRVLSFCASELVNGGYEASNPMVSFQGGSRTARLEAAKAAAKGVMDGNYGDYGLTGTTDDPPADMTKEDVAKYAADFYSVFIQQGEWNNEVIFGVQYLKAQGNRVRPNRWFGPNGYHNWGNNNPLEPVVRSFEMKDGTPFVWDKYSPGDQNVRIATGAELAADPERNPYVGREPRFYASVLYDGAKWQPRPSDGAGIDPEGRIQTGYWKVDENSADTYNSGLDTRQGIIESWNGTKNGYYIKKFIDVNTEGQYYDNENAWVEIRYAEILMDYAEACIELDEVEEGLNALNMVRNRAGLPDRVTTDQAEAREWYRHERQIEFFGEGDRWYQIRKWMIAGDVITDVHPMKIYHYDHGGIEWNYTTTTTADARTFDPINYWLPISRNEINKAPELIQNPGYN
jgi:hypothetical protein